MKLLTLLLSFIFTFEVSAMCIIQTTRIACPGKKAEANKKCKGKDKHEINGDIVDSSCNYMNEEVESIEDCRKFAVKKCINKRFDVTKRKNNLASYHDENDKKSEMTAIKTVGGVEDFCSEDNEKLGYTKQDSFPYYAKDECK